MSGYTYNENVKRAVAEMLEHETTTADEKTKVSGISKTCTRSGYVSHKQGYVLGKIHKRTVCNGQYIKHGWWD